MCRARPSAANLVAGLIGALGALVALAAAAPREAIATNGARPFTAGAKAAGRGGAEVAVSDDALAVANPAGIAFVQGFRADAGLGLIFSRARYKNDLNDDLEEGLSVIPAIGILFDPLGPPEPGPEGAAADAPWLPDSSPVRIGLQFFAPFGGGGDLMFRTALFPDGVDENVEFTVLAVAPTIAFRPIDNLSIGASVYLQYLTVDLEQPAGSGTSQSGQVFVHNVGPTPQPLDPPLTFSDLFAAAGTADANSGAIVDFDDAHAFGIGASFGILWQPIPELSLGAAYTTQGFFQKVKGDARVDATRSIQSLNANPSFASLTGFLFNAFLPNGGSRGFISEYDLEFEFVTPDVISIGAAYRPTPRIMIALDLRYIGWGRAFDSQKVELTGGTNEDLNAINGGTSIEKDNEQNWDDQYVVAVGFAYLVHGVDWLALRCGYNYGSNPIPDESISPTNSGFLEHHVTLGAGVYIDRFDLDVAYIYAFQSEKTIEGSQSTEFNGVRVRAEQHMLYFGVGVRF